MKELVEQIMCHKYSVILGNFQDVDLCTEVDKCLVSY